MSHSVLLSCTDAADAQEAAEAYVLRPLSVSEFERYEEHLLACARCQSAVEEFDVFLSATRAALSEYPDGRTYRRGRRSRAKSASG